jgi:hypothetical protein
MSEPGWGRTGDVVLPKETVDPLIAVGGNHPLNLRKPFFVSVVMCGAWCGYGAYAVVAKNADEAKEKVRKTHFGHWEEKKLTIKAVEINPGLSVQELDEIDAIG